MQSCSRRISSSKEAFLLLQSKAGFLQEEVWVITLTPGKQVISCEQVFKGTVDQCLFHVREVFHVVIKNLASSFILAHTHPSGSLEPSKEDLTLTRRIVKSAKLMEIEILDHIIITESGYRIIEV